MKNSASKILALVLTLVLICTLTTVAFAATSEYVYAEYPSCYIDGTVSITRLKASASLVVEPDDDVSYSGSIRVTYTYYRYGHNGDDDYRTGYVNKTVERPRNGGTAFKEFGAGEIFSMRDATALFSVTGETSDDTFDFHPTRTVFFPYPTE